MRTNDDFENVAMDIYQVFDDVINSLENVDIALKDIRQGAISFPLNKQMIKVDKLGKNGGLAILYVLSNSISVISG